eukprot:135570_1
MSTTTHMQNKHTIYAPELEGKFKIIEKIDHGGYASVFKAIDLHCTTSDNVVAIKRVQSANIKSTHSKHPCIEVTILELFRSNPYFPTIRQVLCDKSSGAYSIVMEYFEHLPFCEYNTILNEQQTIKYIYVLLRCVYALSGKGFVHRDIKPGNFLYNPSQEKYLLIDFGLCQRRSSLASKYDQEVKAIQTHLHKNRYKSKRKPSNSNTKRKVRRSDVYSSNSLQQKTVLKLQVIRDGTPGFRAPEIILASNNQDAKIDVFNVGIILFIAIYGWKKVQSVAMELDRKIQIRALNRDSIYMNNGAKHLNSQSWVSGYENAVQGSGSKLSCWIKKRIKDLDGDKGKENVNHKTTHRQWSEDLYDLLDQLTEFNPFQRLSPRKALEHKIFDLVREEQY